MIKLTEHKQQPNQYKEQYQQIKPNQNYIYITPTYEIQGYCCLCGRFYQPACGIFWWRLILWTSGFSFVSKGEESG